VLDIYVISIDYDPRVEAFQQFFKMGAEHDALGGAGHTAAEIVAMRADATRPNMGLTTWVGEVPRKLNGGRTPPSPGSRSRRGHCAAKVPVATRGSQRSRK